MTRTSSLAFRLVATALAYLLVAVASISVSLWVTWQLEGGAAAVNEAGRLRMMSYRLALDARAGRQTDAREQSMRFHRTLALLREGDPSRPLNVPASPETSRGLARVDEAWATFAAALARAGTAVETEEAAILVSSIDNLVGAIEARLAYWTAALRTFQLTMVALAIAGTVLLVYTSHVLVLEPLRRLGAAIAAIRAGHLETRVAAPACVEFAELADGFNAMAQRLEAQYASLEESVRLKTADLQAQQERLAALYEVSAFVATAETLDELSRGFVTLVRRIAKADGIALRWSDADNARYLMLAQEGLPPTFAAEEQCLPTGDCHCGQVADGSRSRIIPIRTDPATRGHCSKAGFQTLLTVPVTLHHRVHGEIDLFYRSAAAAADPDRPLIELLASHLAGGMEGLRAAAVDKEAAISTERGLLAQELHDSIAQSLAFLKIQVQLLRAALARGEPAAVQRTVAEIETGVQESYGDVRELLVHFRTRADSEDIEPALRTTLRKFQLQTGIATDIDVHGHGVALPNDVQIQVLHIVQEALSNIRKHALATAVSLRLQQAPAWCFEVSDNGVGFDTGLPMDESHVGLRIMIERAGRIGATLAISSQPGHGTTVRLSLPPAHGAEENEHALADSLAGR